LAGVVREVSRCDERAEQSPTRFRCPRCGALYEVVRMKDEPGKTYPPICCRIQEALKAPRRTEGVHKIAERLGVNPSRAQRISTELAGRPFGQSAAA